MKIEKISDNQIKCTLTIDDLTDRKIRLSELAYGSRKTRELFREMLMEAYNRFGFSVDNIPLMIEAVPGADSIVLFISKVEDPEELDTRFSKFTAQGQIPENGFDEVGGADDYLDLFQKIYEARKGAPAPRKETKGRKSAPKKPDEAAGRVICAIRFRNIEEAIAAAAGTAGFYRGPNSLYRRSSGEYVLVARIGDHSPEEFNKAVNILSEYGTRENVTPAGEAHMAEHEKVILKNDALEQLSSLG